MASHVSPINTMVDQAASRTTDSDRVAVRDRVPFEPAKDRLHSSKLYHSLASAGQPTLELRCHRKPDPQSSYSRRSRKPENIIIVVVTAQDRTRQAPANEIERTTSSNRASRSARVYPRRRCRLEVADENVPAVSHPPTSEASHRSNPRHYRGPVREVRSRQTIDMR
jgi:hypothetical protein